MRMKHSYADASADGKEGRSAKARSHWKIDCDVVDQLPLLEKAPIWSEAGQT